MYCIVVIILFVILSSGCATGAKKNSQKPLHAESGVGVTIWKVPIFGIGFWGQDSWWGSGMSSVIVHQYNYRAQPQPAPPGTPPLPPTAMPPAADYPTIYGSSWDDPTLVIFKNNSYRKTKIEINGQKPIVLEPYGATANLHLDIGEHPVRLTIEKPTASHGTWEVVRFFPIYIRPEGRSQIFYLYDY